MRLRRARRAVAHVRIGARLPLIAAVRRRVIATALRALARRG